MLKVISLWAGPGAGKSTLAAALFAAMKRKRFSVELVVEYAKELTYEKAWNNLGDQFQVLADQNHRLERLRGQVEWAITDSPLGLTLAYCKQKDREWFRPIVRGLWDSYDNYPFILQRTQRPYQEFGRNETLDQAVALDERIHALADEFEPVATVSPDMDAAEEVILQQLFGRVPA